ncbi:MAG: hypothetical protein RJA22_1551 [Verrucomicrobiota bacterium]|jgi:hypothetical protein
MNKHLCFILLCLAAASAPAQNTIVSTHTVFPLVVTNGEQVVTLPNTNAIAIPAGFGVRVSSFTPRSWSGSWTYGNIYVQRDGLRWQVLQGDVVQGPCVFDLITSKPFDPSLIGTNPASLTLERWRTPKVPPVR